jgi:hypothetical protein
MCWYFNVTKTCIVEFGEKSELNNAVVSSPANVQTNSSSPPEPNVHFGGDGEEGGRGAADGATSAAALAEAEGSAKCRAADWYCLHRRERRRSAPPRFYPFINLSELVCLFAITLAHLWLPLTHLIQLSLWFFVLYLPLTNATIKILDSYYDKAIDQIKI